MMSSDRVVVEREGDSRVTQNKCFYDKCINFKEDAMWDSPISFSKLSALCANMRQYAL